MRTIRKNFEEVGVVPTRGKKKINNSDGQLQTKRLVNNKIETF
jgi:hypothetical protein